MGKIFNKCAATTLKVMFCTAVSISFLTFGVLNANAADDASAIEEIIVTATKRGAASVQDVPIAISAFDANRLKDLGVTQFDQWAGQVPGLSFEDWGPGDKDIVIRGVNSPTGATVGVYFDEAVITGRFLENGGGRQVDFKLHDIARVEVLKGPQGTLYGANSMSGTIKIIPNKPDLEKFDASAEIEASDTEGAESNNLGINAMLNVPLKEGVAGLRFVGWNQDDAGYINNVRYNEHGVNDAKIKGGRVNLDYQITDDLKLSGIIQTQSVNLDNDNRITPEGITSFGSTPLFGPAMPDVQGGKNISTEFVRTPWDEDANIYGLTAEWALANGNLTATTNQFTRDIDYIYDSTPILQFFKAPVVAVTNQIQEREVQTTEIRYASELEGSFNFVAGLLYQEDDIDFDLNVLTADANGVPIGTFSEFDADDAFIGSGSTIFGRSLSVTSENKAIFGEVNYLLSESFDLTIGGRYFEFESRSISANTHPFFGFQGNPIDFQDRSTSDSKVTLKANLTYHASDDTLWYGNIAQGFRPGGTNAVILPINVSLPEGFDSDELISYELGAKLSRWNNRLVINAALYYTDWEDIQTGNAVQSFSFTDNLGEATIQGFEFDLRYRPSQQWDFSVGGSYIKAELDSDEPTTVGSFPGQKGNDFPNVPGFSGFVSSSYSWNLNAGLKTRATMDYTYRGSSATEFNSNNPFYNDLGSYGLLNANVVLSTANWDVSLFIRNLLDQDEEIDILVDDQEQQASLITRPRTAGLRFKYNF